MPPPSHVHHKCGCLSAFWPSSGSHQPSEMICSGERGGCEGAVGTVDLPALVTPAISGTLRVFDGPKRMTYKRHRMLAIALDCRPFLAAPVGRMHGADDRSQACSQVLSIDLTSGRNQKQGAHKSLQESMLLLLSCGGPCVLQSVLPDWYCCARRTDRLPPATDKNQRKSTF